MHNTYVHDRKKKKKIVTWKIPEIQPRAAAINPKVKSDPGANGGQVSTCPGAAGILFLQIFDHELPFIRLYSRDNLLGKSSPAR